MKIRFFPKDRRRLIRYTELIRQKYGVSSVGLNGQVLASALQDLSKPCRDNAVLGNINSPPAYGHPLHRGRNTLYCVWSYR
jgi:hypothetical protein